LTKHPINPKLVFLLAAFTVHSIFAGPATDTGTKAEDIITAKITVPSEEVVHKSGNTLDISSRPGRAKTDIPRWRSLSGPWLVTGEVSIEDSTGNQNGVADPGETISMLIALTNVGNDTATGISAVLSTTDPYIVITQPTAVYPDLAPFESGTNTPEYQLEISEICPEGHSAICNLHITADPGFVSDQVVSFIVGDERHLPSGPDAYGYYAWDNTDGGPAIPYDWIEIAPAAGGPGTSNGPTGDDATVQIRLPFPFQYYGQSFTQISVCTNGWLALGYQTSFDWSNSSIPNTDGPGNMIAAFWDDLHAGYFGVGSQICTYHDSANHRFIVEWYEIAHYGQMSVLETFQVILLDPVWHGSTSGDGIILVQYHTVSNESSATFGIENETETIGLQYGYNGLYDPNAMPVQAGRTITYTTSFGVPQLQVDLTYLSGSPVPVQGGSVYYEYYLENVGSYPQTFDAWLDLSYQGGPPATLNLRTFSNFQPGWAIHRLDMYLPVPAVYPGGVYTLSAKAGTFPVVIITSDSFSFIKLGNAHTDGYVPFVPEDRPDPFEDYWMYESMVPPPESVTLEIYPNPFNPATEIRYQLAAATHINISIYDVAGRRVTTLVEGWQDTGSHRAVFDASDLASGLYIYCIHAGDFVKSGKLLLVK
jgi:hypothetical protein